jgi:hypothetical protein
MQKETLLKTIWTLSGDYQYGYDIDCLISDLSNKFEWTDDEQTEITKSLIEALKDASEIILAEDCYYAGYCKIIDCYWWQTNAETCWTCDEPDFWEDLIKGDDYYV